MVYGAAFARTRPVMAAKAENMAMSKWWKKKSLRADGEIRMHLSMHEQAPLANWLPKFPKIVMQRLHRYKWPFGVVLSYYLLNQLAEVSKAEEERSHRF
mmetsp:Transcript_594/g.778  ORF Transcript_594/g.778 Transcript_594/m.778 type:complete len:99 (-) Transcript_594:228-524(-)|eukprot:CAMPEP_0198136410 /NCGR_PEP_ID=MMETSP1443-20131203/63_1 /TAXON_ID=186043 /ORGANISM="Entomoneis sp., Strain CCMP2396" /LENGTH=98 /DNA_ID=CAMNT_0043797625 /DNA_START=114 /DNA_END=410 /DNA_ORIENTATION=+